MTETVLRRVCLPVIVASLVAAIIPGCTGRRHQDRFKWREIVASIIAAKQARGGPVYLDVVRVMPFEWEKFYMFPPHTPIDDIEKALGFKWRAAKKTRINERDDITLLVFVIRPGYAYPPREGYFECVEEKQEGRSVFYFVEAQRYR
jgi:hypothetical protein